MLAARAFDRAHHFWLGLGSTAHPRSGTGCLLLLVLLFLLLLLLLLLLLELLLLVELLRMKPTLRSVHRNHAS